MAKKIDNVAAVYVKNSNWSEAIAAEHRLSLVRKNFTRLGDIKAADACTVLIQVARDRVDAEAKAAMKHATNA